MTDKSTVFDFVDYKQYLSFRLGRKGARRGLKTQAADAIGCQATFISQVLNDNAHLSLEQAFALNRFLGHSEDEGRFFLLVVQRDRAGTKDLREHFSKEMAAVLKRRLTLEDRLGPKKTLDETERNAYYSSWIYIATHIGCTIPDLQNPAALAKYLDLPLSHLIQVLDRLESIGLLQKEALRYLPRVNEIRIGRDENHTLRHHTNWRLQAIEHLPFEGEKDLHYSGVMSISHADQQKIKDVLLEQLKENLQIVKTSKEEQLCCLNLDFFKLAKT